MDNHYIAFVNTREDPLKYIELTPKKITFEERLFINGLEDKINDNTEIPFIPCYNSIDRAVEMCKKGKNIKNFDIYIPIEYKLSDLYRYEYLVNRGLITPKDYNNREEWFVNPVKCQYYATIDNKGNLQPRNTETMLEGNTVEDDFVRRILAKKNVNYLFKCTENRERILPPDTYNLGNRISKPRMSSFWYISPIQSMLNYVSNYLVGNNIVDETDLILLYKKEILYIREYRKDDVLKALKNINFFINIILIPKFDLMSGKDLGFGWKRYDWAFSYDKSLYPGSVREVTADEFIDRIKFVNEAQYYEKLKSKKSEKISKWMNFEGFIYKDKYQDKGGNF